MESRETMLAAAAEIRRWAPTQSHAVRRAMFHIADMFDGGVDLGTDPSNMVFIDTPVKADGKFVGWAQTRISFGANPLGHPGPGVDVHAEFDYAEEGS